MNQVTLPDSFITIISEGILHEVGLDWKFIPGRDGSFILSTAQSNSVAIYLNGATICVLTEIQPVILQLNAHSVVTFQLVADHTLVRKIFDLFHDQNLNPCSGALSLEEIIFHLKSPEPEVLNAVRNEALFRTYHAKGGTLSVVLQSSAKLPRIEGDFGNSQLLQETEKRLGEGPKTINSLFNEIRLCPEHSRLLTAGFTTLKKFLMKNNREILWYQTAKATRVKKREIFEA